MIKRINLIDKSGLSFTYQQVLGVVLAICLVIVGIGGFRVYRVDADEGALKAAEDQLAKLEKEKDKLQEKPKKQKVSVGEYQELFDTLDNTPPWSRILFGVSKELPNNVWITNFGSKKGEVKTSIAGKKSFRKKSDDEKKADEKKAEQEAPKAMGTILEIEGVGQDMRGVTGFVAALKQVKYLKHLTLTESTEQAFGYTFKLTAEFYPEGM